MAVLCRRWLLSRRACSRACQSAPRPVSVSRPVQVHIVLDCSIHRSDFLHAAKIVSECRAAYHAILITKAGRCATAPYNCLQCSLMSAGLLGGSALLDFALALERQIQSTCFGALAMPSAAADAEALTFFAAPRNQMVCTSYILRPVKSFSCQVNTD